MKRVFAMILALAMLASLTACGGGDPAAKTLDCNALYESFGETLPEMIVMDDATRVNFFGIDAADCTQVVTAICADGLRADEVWLIEAKDAAALEKLKGLAESRMAAKADETISYVPDQYAIVEKGVVLTSGSYLALLVSPEVDALQAAFEAAVK